MPKKITLESLAAMVKNGFGSMHQEFRGEFGLVHREIGDIKLKLDQAAYRFELNELEGRVKMLERHTGLAKS